MLLKVLSFRSHIVRAFYNWCCESRQTPYIMARVREDTGVPDRLIENGRVTFNISSVEAKNLAINAEGIFFTTRFLQETRDIGIPLRDVLAVYAKESEEGLLLDDWEEMPAAGAGAKTEDDQAAAKPRRNNIHVLPSATALSAAHKKSSDRM